MGAQGLISICHHGAVVMKIVAGSNGYKALFVEHEIRELGKVPTLEVAYELALKHGFGRKEDLVVLTESSFYPEGDGILGSKFRQGFEDPKACPDWEGDKDHALVIEFP